MSDDFPPMIGKYKVLGIIAKGGMGVVYKAIHPSLKRYVVIKKMTARGKSASGNGERFKKEAQILLDMQSPYIVHLFDYFTEGGFRYMVEELVDGAALDKLIEKQTALKYTLEQEGYETDSAMDGEEALSKFETGSFDLILLDVMLPKLDGIAVCQRIRERSDIPIIMLTAKGEDMDKILGLEYGADDYMTKPFNILEVKARIKTILRRVSGSVQQQEHRVIRVHDMEVNLIKRSVTLGGKDIKLTAKEFDLLQMFVTNRGTVFSREQMLETVWKYDYAGDARTVDVHIRRLREKIERDTSKPEFIFTKWGVGYYFTDQD